MLDKAMKYAIAIVGAMTGFSVTRFVLMSAGMNLMSFTSIGIMVAASVAFGMLMLFFGGKIVSYAAVSVDKIEKFLQSLTLYELMVCVAGLIAGLIVANLLSVALMRIQVIGIPLTIVPSSRYPIPCPFSFPSRIIFTVISSPETARGLRAFERSFMLRMEIPLIEATLFRL